LWLAEALAALLFFLVTEAVAVVAVAKPNKILLTPYRLVKLSALR
jgi:hypothetical protein